MFRNNVPKTFFRHELKTKAKVGKAKGVRKIKLKVNCGKPMEL